MLKHIILATVLAPLALQLAQAEGYKPMILPAPPKPAPTLPLGAEASDKGVYVPVSKSGNTGVSIEKLPNPAPGEKGGAVSLTIKTK